MISDKDLIAKLSSELDITNVEAKKAFKSLVDFIKSKLQAGEQVRIGKFGKFFVRQYNERIGVNPRTKEKFTIPPRKRVRFLAFSTLRELIK